jgi:hypothetical protein
MTGLALRARRERAHEKILVNDKNLAPGQRVGSYRMRDGRFCLIDFELATLLPGFESSGDKP